MWPLSAVSFLKSNWKAIALAMLVAGVLLYIHTLKVERAHLHTQVTELNAQITTLKNNNAVLESSIKATNTALERTSEAAKQTKDGFAALGATVTAANNNVASKLAKIQTGVKPSTCEDTLKYLINAAQEYHQ
jgi:peptidoglycan hydrolase CwlO-like protein